MLNQIIIRKANKSDAKKISLAFREVFTPLFKEQNLSILTMEKMYQDNNVENILERLNSNYFFVALDVESKNIVGVIGLRKNDGSEKYDRVSTFFVLEQHRGKGVGKRLFGEIMRIVKELGVKKLVVNSSLYAEHIYTHWGFQKVEITQKVYPNGDIYQNVWMEKILDIL